MLDYFRGEICLFAFGTADNLPVGGGCSGRK